jgi:hypothetical protein
MTAASVRGVRQHKLRFSLCFWFALITVLSVLMTLFAVAAKRAPVVHWLQLDVDGRSAVLGVTTGLWSRRQRGLVISSLPRNRDWPFGGGFTVLNSSDGHSDALQQATRGDLNRYGLFVNDEFVKDWSHSFIVILFRHRDGELSVIDVPCDERRLAWLHSKNPGADAAELRRLADDVRRLETEHQNPTVSGTKKGAF